MTTRSERLARFFSDSGYVWNFSDGRRIPSEEEIQKTIESAIEYLASQEDNTQVEVGRLLIKKRDGFYDVFVMAQEFS